MVDELVEVVTAQSGIRQEGITVDVGAAFNVFADLSLHWRTLNARQDGAFHEAVTFSVSFEQAHDGNCARERCAIAWQAGCDDS